MPTKLDYALAFASRFHEGQVRKGTEIPYISHPLAVCSLVLEDGGSNTEATAAVLHDILEDTDAPPILIRANFGDEVLSIIKACSDTTIKPKPPWRERKEAHLAHLQTASEAVLRVVCADKLHNATSIVNEFDSMKIWEKFNAPYEDQMWYYSSMVALMNARLTNSQLPQRLKWIVNEIGEQADDYIWAAQNG